MKLPSNNVPAEIREELRQQVLELKPGQFEELALKIFRYQAALNPIYREYISYRKINLNRVERLTEVPFLPIQFFKNHPIRTGFDRSDVAKSDPSITFESSGTSGTNTSRHQLHDAQLYKTISTSIFQQQYGELSQYHLLALLPSYLERNNSSLVYMIRHFIDQTGSDFSGFYLKNTEEMLRRLRDLAENQDGRPVLLMGVTFALLDLAESAIDFSFFRKLPEFTVMDTGGMKGRREELLREEVHDILTKSFGVSKIHSEYGMTELLSQAYSKGDGLFYPGVTMRVLLRETNDPFSVFDQNPYTQKTGGINVIDLANLDSCSFIETQDLGRYGPLPETFYVMGRFDNSDVRGCNLMVL